MNTATAPPPQARSVRTPAHLNTEYHTAAAAGLRNQPVAGTAGTSDLKRTRKRGRFNWAEKNTFTFFKVHVILSPSKHINTWS